MASEKYLYLPKWQRAFLMPVFVSIWLFVSYMEFFNPEPGEKLGIVGYLFLSLVFLGMGTMMWLMTSGKLPAYIIKTKEEKS